MWACLEKVGTDVYNTETGEPTHLTCDIMGCPAEGTLQRVLSTGVTPSADPTVFYRLACGSAVL